MTPKHTPGPWAVFSHGFKKTGAYIKRKGAGFAEGAVAIIPRSTVKPFEANAKLIAAAPSLLAEMERYLLILERAEAIPETWNLLTVGTGIATANGYRAAIKKALA